MNPCCHDGSGKITKGKIVFLLAAIIVVKSFGLVVVQWARVVNLLLSQHQSNSSMINHLGSKEHKTTLDLLYDKVESHFFSAGGEKRERSRGKHLLAPSQLP